MQTVDVGALLDAGRWSGYQKLLVGAVALAIVIDGFDNQLMAIALLPLMREWDVPRAAFAAVFASGMVGMMVGGAIGGLVGDRLGRRTALAGSVALFGAFTGFVALVDNLTLLGVLRFITGIGLGAAMPNSAALAAEYVPARKRAFAVTLTIMCISVGGTLAGVVGAQLLPILGWRTLFLAGGAAAVALSAVLWTMMPESPRYLARQPGRRRELVGVLRRFGHEVPDSAQFIDPAETPVARPSPRELLHPGFRRDTVALGFSFFFCMLSVYVGINWVPSMLAGAGFDVSVAGNGLAVFNLGGIAGALLGGAVVIRAGSRPTMLAMSAAAVAGAVLMAATPLAFRSALFVLVMLAWTGGFINAVQTMMYALAAHVYPTGIRATGVGTAVSVGRLGGVLSPYAGAWALESGPARLFALLAVTMTLVGISLAAVRRHVPGRHRGEPGSGRGGAPANVAREQHDRHEDDHQR
jgi:AAHS family 4-hydroxybenzoate transporter-like MFS transporter